MVVGVMTPLTDEPGRKGASNLTPNHNPNSVWSVRARQTRDNGARNRTCFSIRSETAVLMCNLLVASLDPPQPKMQLMGCA